MAQAAEFLSFRLGREAYGIEIRKVQEIRTYETPTALANAPVFIKGVINLRGVIVPILDLRARFRLPSVAYDAFTVVIVLNVLERVIGVVVDAVSDVVVLEPDDIRAAPDFASSVFASTCITGLGTCEDQMLILLDIERLMTSAEMALTEHTAH